MDAGKSDKTDRPLLLDGHIHVREGAPQPDMLAARMAAAGVDGGVLLSLPPASCIARGGAAQTAAQRLRHVLTWAQGHARWYPFLWIDPTEPDAAAQVDAAVQEGIAGFKVICARHDPCADAAMPVYARIAHHGKPLLFHSGILWDGQPSSRHNRPAGFEGLLAVEGLRFALAHISWPWCDECLAVYGKFQNALSLAPDIGVEMFIDITPGTPPIYRRDALTRLHTIGYDIVHNILFGSDCSAPAYNVQWVLDTRARDGAIYEELGLSQDTLALTYGRNLLRFLGLTRRAGALRPLMPAQ